METSIFYAMMEEERERNELENKKKRVGRPKVKTGCITCKVRRVKCDENRPECCRCIKFGLSSFKMKY
jgi:Fungal Zn(2)-Cys(6) binuclear cluster domain